MSAWERPGALTGPLPAFGPSRACAWAVPERRSPPSMRATSATRASPSTGCTSRQRLAALQRLGDDEVLVGAGGHLRQVRHGQHLAACAPSCFISRPTLSATAPPMPASISSKISVGTPLPSPLRGRW